MSIFEPISKDLDMVKTMLHKQYLIKAGHLSSFAHLDFSPLNSTIRPAMVILSSRLFNYINTRVIALAAVVQFIYMASTIHARINEDSGKKKAGIDPKDGSQFPVLVGDYLYGKFFTSLCDAQIVQYLNPLSQVICSIHEGGILRHKASNSGLTELSTKEKIVYKETATLFETGCKLAADLAGASELDQEYVAGFGRELGTAYGLVENKIYYEYIAPHFEKASHFLDRLPQNNYQSILKGFLSQLQKDAPILIKENGR